jgi:hypothetical protein
MASIRHVVDQNHNVTELHNVVVHRFFVAECEDPDIYAAQPMWEWENSEQGKFIKDCAVGTPTFHKQLNYRELTYEFVITAELPSKKLTEFYLKWGKP